MLDSAQRFSHTLLTQYVKPNDFVIDATMGNGHDTLFLAQLVGKQGKVIALDIQEQALQNTTQLLQEHSALDQCELHLLNHANIYQVLNNNMSISAAIFNLGYLPNADKTIITNGDTTLQSIKQILPHLQKNGLIILVLYDGHTGGLEEKESVINYTSSLPQKEYHVLHYHFLNQQNNPPQLIAIQKR
ncbi:methyltransferase domain-containing protein [Granulicatella sp. zg-ZJ]|uniref:tRNA (mnm(5)s(2)U34)-methyltransferase n=1 Tax=Granulicatella sp. zg-ZJ TaxID=2678504 RepID=UPI0013D1B7E2|nr:class I SAM-dependent methyltransferase [Granulicatella sp. zg-ZJ]NEW61769.1 methyltransferase domain-containing protein [Granulicatella sp. zg-ZJ]